MSRRCWTACSNWDKRSAYACGLTVFGTISGRFIVLRTARRARKTHSAISLPSLHRSTVCSAIDCQCVDQDLQGFVGRHIDNRLRLGPARGRSSPTGARIQSWSCIRALARQLCDCRRRGWEEKQYTDQQLLQARLRTALLQLASAQPKKHTATECASQSAHTTTNVGRFGALWPSSPFQEPPLPLTPFHRSGDGALSEPFLEDLLRHWLHETHRRAFFALFHPTFRVRRCYLV